MKKGEVGRETEAYCSKCKVDTIHMITSVESDIISRVMCQLCFSYHKYKAPQAQDNEKETKVKRSLAMKNKKTSASSEKTPTKAATPKPRKTRAKKTVSWDDLIKTVNEEDAVTYTIDGAYDDGMVLDHKTFGIGVIKSVLSETKMEVVFQGGMKILVQNYSE